MELNTRCTVMIQILIQVTSYQLNPLEKHLIKKVVSYNMQDAKTGPAIEDNVKEDDYEYFRDIVYKRQCWFCNVRFTNKNPTTLDRIDNSLSNNKVICNKLGHGVILREKIEIITQQKTLYI
ncbi:MAG: hypothetical protein EZS28_043164 [Streblomastix strix]|uniref:Uncharacterized protein n=1 Tax=Streblomastix strix TaxID=222440 RepID=A0A5J4TTS7_9EUKA|nr:MAG: hypothetical protein EZS28_043164 [Streblomastix strix]